MDARTSHQPHSKLPVPPECSLEDVPAPPSSPPLKSALPHLLPHAPHPQFLSQAFPQNKILARVSPLAPASGDPSWPLGEAPWGGKEGIGSAFLAEVLGQFCEERAVGAGGRFVGETMGQEASS